MSHGNIYLFTITRAMCAWVNVHAAWYVCYLINFHSGVNKLFLILILILTCKIKCYKNNWTRRYQNSLKIV